MPEYGDPKDKNSVLARADDLVMICTGSNSGEVFTGKIGLVASTMARIDVSPSINQSYVRYFLQMHFHLLNGAMKGMTIPSLDRQLFNALTIPVPTLDEQQRIVRRLDEAVERIDIAKANAEANLQSARAIFESHLNSVFADSGRVFETEELGDVCDFKGGAQPPKADFIYEPKLGYVRFLQIRDFGSNRNITYIRESTKNRLCRSDDILIGRYGASVGKILTGQTGAYNVALIKAAPKLAKLEPSWLYHYLRSDAFQSRLGKIADRSAQAGFSKDDIHAFPIPIPPLTEQQFICSQINRLEEQIQSLVSNYSSKLVAIKELRSSLLRQAFVSDPELV
jgi:type I restriction enzyme S subunit